MKRKRFSVEQNVGILKQAEVGVPVAEVIRKAGIAEQTFYRRKKQYVGLEVDQVRQLKQVGQRSLIGSVANSKTARGGPRVKTGETLDQAAMPRIRWMN